MIRALTIRFAIVALFAACLVAGLNWLDPAPQLGMIALMAYCLAVSIALGRYCLAHEDEIRMRLRNLL
jgi:hypothetical protein